MRKPRPERRSQYESASYRDLCARVALNVERLRKKHGWSQDEAAHRARMSTRLIQRVEAEETNLTFTTLARLVEAFEVDVRELFKPPRRRNP